MIPVTVPPSVAHRSLEGIDRHARTHSKHWAVADHIRGSRDLERTKRTNEKSHNNTNQATIIKDFPIRPSTQSPSSSNNLDQQAKPSQAKPRGRYFWVDLVFGTEARTERTPRLASPHLILSEANRDPVTDEFDVYAVVTFVLPALSFPFFSSPLNSSSSDLSSPEVPVRSL
ncbi:hypothetical protein WAI453_004515 [Rhynchosporium graminicola]